MLIIKNFNYLYLYCLYLIVQFNHLILVLFHQAPI